ncbi:unnamed protein product [Microthlaspi erraticum]|uniref:VQ domain-containing protein n=1 Tax=Microthlaspi erraticum TaxID=1685480 RepID=A0A6D2KR55_9BRAS|nr:unnamed protein product [Microthlaspi erraticum]
MEIEATTVQKRRSLSTIAMHKQSRTLTKSKPKIRIIHVFAPEIIKTDVSNFRELVQKLTGKPDHHHDIHQQKGINRNPRSRGSHDHHHHHQVHDMNKSQGFCINSEVEDEEEEEEEMASMTWNGNGGESSGGFLNGLGDFDGFIQELGEFPYLPLNVDPSFAPSSSSHLHGGVFAESNHFA